MDRAPRGRDVSRSLAKTVLAVNILGISCFFHDAAAALLQDGVLVAAAEEERFTRKKHDFGFPIRAIEYVLASAGIPAGELDYVVFFEKPFLKFERILMTSLQMFPRALRVFREATLTWLLDKLWVSALITERSASGCRATGSCFPNTTCRTRRARSSARRSRTRRS